MRTCVNCGESLNKEPHTSYLRPDLPDLPDIIRWLLERGSWALYATPCLSTPYLLVTEYDTIYRTSSTGVVELHAGPIQTFELGDVCVSNVVLVTEDSVSSQLDD